MYCFRLDRLGNSTVRQRDRRGSIYIVTISTAMIISALAIAALTLPRTQRRLADDGNETRQAQLYAESGLQIAYYRMRTDTAWRSKLISGTWNTDQAIGDGSYRFYGSDPIDGDLSNGAYDPVAITVTGTKGTTTQILRAHFEIEQPGMNCLGAAAYAHTDFTIENITATAVNAPFGSGKKIQGKTNAIINANCEAKDGIDLSGGAVINGSQSSGTALRTLPVAADVLNYYVTNGTTILATSLPWWDREYLANPGFESGTTGWGGYLCTIATSTAFKKSGASSLYVSNRSGNRLAIPATASSPYQLVTTQIASGVAYDVSAWVYVNGLLNADKFYVGLYWNYSSSSGSGILSSPVVVSNGSWVNLSAQLTPVFTSPIVSAQFFIYTDNELPFYLDDCSMVETAAESNTRVIHRRLFSPSHNPITGVLNTKGIYVVDCAGTDINLRDSRIKGTLVVKDGGNGTRIEGSVLIDPKTYLSTDPDIENFPALVIEKRSTIQLGSANLSETAINLNLNPTGASYTNTDSDKTDVYPSVINGLIYSIDDLTFAGNTRVDGVVVSANKIDAKATDPATTSLTVTHQPLYFYVNPPVPFRAPSFIQLIRGTAQQISN